MNNPTPIDYAVGTLDLEQRCHCCGSCLEFDTESERMRCLNRFCSAYSIWFTIPYAKREVRR